MSANSNTNLENSIFSILQQANFNFQVDIDFSCDKVLSYLNEKWKQDLSSTLFILTESFYSFKEGFAGNFLEGFSQIRGNLTSIPSKISSKSIEVADNITKNSDNFMKILKSLIPDLKAAISENSENGG